MITEDDGSGVVLQLGVVDADAGTFTPAAAAPRPRPVEAEPVVTQDIEETVALDEKKPEPEKTVAPTENTPQPEPETSQIDDLWASALNKGKTADSIAADNPLLRYSYEDHFIMRSAYVFYMSNLRNNIASSAKQRKIYTLRSAWEIAGNLLYAISTLSSMKRAPSGEYEILGISYSQYAKADLDYAYTLNLNEKNALAFHVGAGIIYPYGNSDMVPFEKRYYSGGANSVRGWSVRTLGPGTYSGHNPLADFMNQCGDIRLDMNAEYRSKLIWKLELALFLDAGNIWTIKDYPSQPGGQFKLNSSYKEIALAYGLGVRFDFNYFLIRVDMGLKMYDPSRIGNRPWVIAHHSFDRDASFHFAIGYPF